MAEPFRCALGHQLSRGRPDFSEMSVDAQGRCLEVEHLSALTAFAYDRSEEVSLTLGPTEHVLIGGGLAPGVEVVTPITTEGYAPGCRRK